MLRHAHMLKMLGHILELKELLANVFVHFVHRRLNWLALLFYGLTALFLIVLLDICIGWWRLLYADWCLQHLILQMKGLKFCHGLLHRIEFRRVTLIKVLIWVLAVWNKMTLAEAKLIWVMLMSLIHLLNGRRVYTLVKMKTISMWLWLIFENNWFGLWLLNCLRNFWRSWRLFLIQVYLRFLFCYITLRRLWLFLYSIHWHLSSGGCLVNFSCLL